MQETRVNKVSRRFYIDHADDHAVVRAVPVIRELKPRQEAAPSAPATNESTNPRAPRGLGKLATIATRRPHRKHG